MNKLETLHTLTYLQSRLTLNETAIRYLEKAAESVTSACEMAAQVNLDASMCRDCISDMITKLGQQCDADRTQMGQLKNTEAATV